MGADDASPLQGRFLSKRALQGLAAYQYKAGGYTILDYLHNPIWNAIVDRLPMWLAPNLITLTGTLFIIAAFFVPMWYQPDYAGESPRWVYLFAAIAVFLYVNLDCMDGKQARRTKSSSPLGQLFDHGCDAISLPLLMATARSVANVPCSWGGVTMEMAVMVPWLLAHWEEYHTGVMLYGNGFFGVLEGNYALFFMDIISFCYGPTVWAAPLPFQLPPPLSGIKTVRDGLFGVVAVAAVITAVGQVYRVAVFRSGSLTAKEAGHKQLGSGAAVLHLAYLAVLCGVGSVWVGWDVTPLDAAVRRSTAGGPPLWRWLLTLGVHRLPVSTFGIVYASIALQLIVAHMSKEPFMPFAWAIAVLALGSGNAVLQVVNPLVLNAILFTIALAAYVHYIRSLINQICAFLGICCLTIPVHKPGKD